MPSRAEADAVIASSDKSSDQGDTSHYDFLPSRDCDVMHKPPVERLFRHIRSKIIMGFSSCLSRSSPHRI